MKIRSWEILNESTVCKDLDYSSFKHKTSGVPQQLYSFFNINSQNKDKIFISLIDDDNISYKSYIRYTREKSSPVRLVVWGSDFDKYLKERTKNWDRIKPGEVTDQYKLYFKKTNNKDEYKISLNIIKNNEKRYFIFDTGVPSKNPGESEYDIEFKQYFWSKGQYNKVREGDYFLYRKPTKVSENNKFYFFGSGKVGKISSVGKNKKGDENVICKIEKPIRFTDLIFQDDPKILNYKWKWKERNPSKGWGQFFNNYGMNLIPKEDFEFIHKIGTGTILDSDLDEQNEEMVKSHINFIYQEHEVEDRYGKVKTRGYEQKVFSDNIKIIYDNKCCVTGITTRSLLQGCHISSHSKDKENRCNPNNGLCMSLLIHKCFDEGLIMIDSDYILQVSKKITDTYLLSYLNKFNGKKINLPVKKEFYPDKKFLKKHSIEVFEKKM